MSHMPEDELFNRALIRLADEPLPRPRPRRRRRRRRGRGSRLRDVRVLGPTLLLLLVAVPWAGGAVGDQLLEGVRNGTTSHETEIVGSLDATGGAKGGYVTRQSNTRTGAKAGGGAIYGCRGAAGGTAAGSAPCVRASNLAAGYAFEFAAQGAVASLRGGSPGPVAGLITVGDPKVLNATARPFMTNATAVATGLNADRLDNRHADELITEARDDTLWATVAVTAATSTLGAGKGVTAVTGNSGVTNVDFGRDVSACAKVATRADVVNNGAGVGVAGEISVAELAGAPNRVSVWMFDSAGATAAPGIDGGFHLVVVC